MHIQDTIAHVYQLLQDGDGNTPEQLDLLAELPLPAREALRGFAKSTKGDKVSRPVGFVSVVGSVNYKTNDELSDVDLKATYLPSFSDLYHNSFPTFDIVTPSFDVTMASIHQYKNHMLKGNINFIEPLYAEHIALNPALDTFWDVMKMLVEMNVTASVVATFGMQHEKFKKLNATKDIQHPVLDGKSAASIVRLLHFIDVLVRTGEFVIVPEEGEKEMIRALRHDEITYDDFYAWYLSAHETIRDLAFVENADAKLIPSSAVLELDQSKTPEFAELSQLADKTLMAAIFDGAIGCQ